jgi:flagellar assembly factor FliW
MKINRPILKPDKSRWDNPSGNSAFHEKVGRLIHENAVFHFPSGIPAFEDSRRFVILLNESIVPFVYLKSLDIEDLGFVCVDPFLICAEYSINIPAKDLSVLELRNPGDALVLSMVTVESDPKLTTANLLAPVIINMKNNIGGQVILNEQYPVRYIIWEGLERFRASE